MTPTGPSILAVAALILLGACNGSGTPTAPGPARRNTNFRAVEAFAYTLIGANRPLRLQGINGTVQVTAGPTGSAVTVTVTGEREVRSDSQQDADAQLPLLQVDVQDAGSEILVSTRQPSNPEGRSYVVNYILTVPAATELDIVNVNGSVDIHDTAGHVSVRVTNGRVEAAARVRPGGAVRLTTINGEIVLHLPRDTSAVFSAQVANGSITLTNLVLQNEARTGTSLRGTLGAGDGTVSLQTTNGGIRVDGTS